MVGHVTNETSSTPVVCAASVFGLIAAAVQLPQWTLADRPLFSVTENTGSGGSRPFQIVSFIGAVILLAIVNLVRRSTLR